MFLCLGDGVLGCHLYWTLFFKWWSNRFCSLGWEVCIWVMEWFGQFLHSKWKEASQDSNTNFAMQGHNCWQRCSHKQYSEMLKGTNRCWMDSTTVCNLSWHLASLWAWQLVLIPLWRWCVCVCVYSSWKGILLIPLWRLCVCVCVCVLQSERHTIILYNVL